MLYNETLSDSRNKITVTIYTTVSKYDEMFEWCSNYPINHEFASNLYSRSSFYRKYQEVGGDGNFYFTSESDALLFSLAWGSGGLPPQVEQQDK